MNVITTILEGVFKNAGPGGLNLSVITFKNNTRHINVLKLSGEPGGSKFMSAIATVKNRIAIQSGFFNNAYKNHAPANIMMMNFCKLY
jgi:hypothetical protein